MTSSHECCQLLFETALCVKWIDEMFSSKHPSFVCGQSNFSTALYSGLHSVGMYEQILMYLVPTINKHNKNSVLGLRVKTGVSEMD